MKRLRVALHPPSRDGEVGGVRFQEYEVGPAGRPAYIVVVRSPRSCDVDTVIRHLSDSTAARRLGGAPVLSLPPGGEFEVWELEPDLAPRWQR